MGITKDFIRAVLCLKTISEKKDIEDIHQLIYTANQDLALFCDNERYDNDANKFRNAVIELSTKLSKKYSLDDVRTVTKYYELMKDWSIVDNIRKLAYDFNILTCDAETIDGLRECVVDYVYDNINKVDKLVESDNQTDSFLTNLVKITADCLYDSIDNEIIVTNAYWANLLILERYNHTIFMPYESKDLDAVNRFIDRRKKHSNLITTKYEYMHFKQDESSQSIYIVCTYDTLNKKYNIILKDDLRNAIKKYFDLTPKFDRFNFIIKYKDN